MYLHLLIVHWYLHVTLCRLILATLLSEECLSECSSGCWWIGAAQQWLVIDSSMAHHSIQFKWFERDNDSKPEAHAVHLAVMIQARAFFNCSRYRPHPTTASCAWLLTDHSFSDVANQSCVLASLPNKSSHPAPSHSAQQHQRAHALYCIAPCILCHMPSTLLVYATHTRYFYDRSIMLKLCQNLGVCQRTALCNHLISNTCNLSLHASSTSLKSRHQTAVRLFAGQQIAYHA